MCLPGPVLWRASRWAAQKVLGYGAFCALVVAAVRGATLSGRVGSLVAAAANMTCPWNDALYGNLGSLHHLSCSGHV